MLYTIMKAVISGVLIGLISEVAKRSPAIGAIITSLPLIAILATIWLWRDTGDVARTASYLQATFWYVLPSLPMFMLVPYLLRAGVPFWAALTTGCGLTVILYLLMIWLAPRLN